MRVADAETGFLDLPDRVVVSPSFGRFEPEPPRTVTAEGELVRKGDRLGEVRRGDERAMVPAPCDGWVLTLLVRSGEKVRPGTPLVWVREL